MVQLQVNQKDTYDERLDMINDHGKCPHCNTDLNGGFIWDTFFERHGSEEEADRISKMYGASKGNGKWGRQIGIYDLDKDRTVSWRCPDCTGEWPR